MTDKSAKLVLYRKYRSRDFDELIGQSHITAALSNALVNGRLGHAYLFTGPRGVGKTSAARILARRINQLTPEAAENHLDIIEIDAASNRRIDEVRDLREKVYAAPTSAAYKVYIIDEVHMLTTEAFNALLKTLEEPPAHVVFILATTEPQKLPETIISRTQRFSFRTVMPEVLASHLKQVATTEKINISDNALQLIASAAGGSVRDSLSLLDQVANLGGGNKIEEAQVSGLLGLAAPDAINQILKALADNELLSLVEILDNLQLSGVNLGQFIEQLEQAYQKLLRANLVGKDNSQYSAVQLSDLIKKLAVLNGLNHVSWLALEAELVGYGLGIHPAKVIERPVKTADQPLKAADEPSEQAIKVDMSNPVKAVFDDAAWLKALSIIKAQHNSLYALLRAAAADYDPANEQLEVGFRFQFHKRRLEEGKNRQILEAALEKVCGGTVVVVPVLLKPDSVTAATDQPMANNEAIESVLDVLGGEVVGKPSASKSYTKNSTKVG